MGKKWVKINYEKIDKNAHSKTLPFFGEVIFELSTMLIISLYILILIIDFAKIVDNSPLFDGDKASWRAHPRSRKLLITMLITLWITHDPAQ